jgi:23S rRNA (guanine745-N1)-methyltransferase
MKDDPTVLARRVTPPLACTVRDCGLLLQRHDRHFVCGRAHSYDIARSGYVNLLQPQDRRSRAAGDAADAVAARARLLAAGIGRGALDAMTARVAGVLEPASVVADLGAGSGELLREIHTAVPCLCIGIDLSIAAAGHAARAYPELTWVVANADRGVPLLDGCVDLVLSLNGRRNPQGCARALARRGHLVIAVPGAADLRELRTEVLGEARDRHRLDAVIDEHAGEFAVVERFSTAEVHDLQADQVRDLLRGTYRGARSSTAARVSALSALRVTFASDVVVLRRR